MRKALAAVGVTLLISVVFGAFSSVYADATELVNLLTQKLGVTQEQAKGGAGAIFNTAKEKLSAEDFSKVENAVPGMDDLLAAAPKSDALGGMTGGMQSFRGGGTEAVKGMASLPSSFSKLGLSPDMIGQFTPIVLDYVESKGGATVRKILQGVLL